MFSSSSFASRTVFVLYCSNKRTGQAVHFSADEQSNIFTQICCSIRKRVNHVPDYHTRVYCTHKYFPKTRLCLPPTSALLTVPSYAPVENCYVVFKFLFKRTDIRVCMCFYDFPLLSNRTQQKPFITTSVTFVIWGCF